MPSGMEDPGVVHIGPRPIEECILEPYDVQLPSGVSARLIPVTHPGIISASLIAYLTNEMNNEVSR